MKSATDLSSFVSSAGIHGLQLREDVSEPHWRFWEYRTLNRHRVVAHWSARHGFAGVDELNSMARSTVTKHFRPSWWRGLGFGVVVDVVSLNIKGPELERLIDLRDNSKGVFQWVILRSSLDPVVLGVHTWMEGFLSPVYRAVLRGLSEDGYEVASIRRSKDAITQFLTDFGDLGTAVHTLGMQTSQHREFRNEI